MIEFPFEEPEKVNSIDDEPLNDFLMNESAKNFFKDLEQKHITLGKSPKREANVSKVFRPVLWKDGKSPK